MFQNSLELSSSKRGQLYLLGVTTDSLPRMTALGYIAQKSAPEGTEYLSQDTEDPHLFYRIIALTPIKPGWNHWNAEGPCYPLEAPAPFLLIGETRDDETA